MARKRINFEDIDVQEDSPVIDLVPVSAGQITAQRPDGTFEVITREDAERKRIREYISVSTNQQDIVRGSVKSDLLLQDLKLFHKYFLSDFDGIQTTIDLCGDDPDNDPDYILISKFPLPDQLLNSNRSGSIQRDWEDVIVVITDYPEYGPFGIHVRDNSPNKELIESALEGHQFDNPIGHPDSDYKESVKDLEKLGWIWICFHYRDSAWHINHKDLKMGDCLAKYLENLYAALCGAKHAEF